MKTFYKMEMNWGYKAKKLADTADQDMDKTRTYDYARLEYSHLETLLFIGVACRPVCLTPSI